MVVVYDDSVAKMTFAGSKDLELFVSSQQLRTAFQHAGIRARRYIDLQTAQNQKPRSGRYHSGILASQRTIRDHALHPPTRDRTLTIRTNVCSIGQLLTSQRSTAT